MRIMKGKIITNQENQKKSILLSIIILLIGIVLVTNSNQIVIIGFQCIGACILLFGIYELIRFFTIKKQLKTEIQSLLLNGVMCSIIGLLTILGASILELGLRYIIGFYLILSGVNKIGNAFLWRKDSSNIFYIYLIEGLILTGFGLYTVFYANAALMLIGVLLIISSIFDFITYFKVKK